MAVVESRDTNHIENITDFAASPANAEHYYQLVTPRAP